MAARHDESRDLFRVNCRVMLACRDCGTSTPPVASADSYFPDSVHLNLLHELGRIDNENGHLLHAIAEADRNLSTYLGTINKKIDTVARHLVAQVQSGATGVEQEVSLSEGGLSFRSSESIEAGSIVALHLTLLPTYLGFAVYADVVSCEHEDSVFRISSAFRSLPEGDRQIISRHVMQVQLSAQRKRAMQE